MVTDSVVWRQQDIKVVRATQIHAAAAVVLHLQFECSIIGAKL
jgi:hypothetical protein